MEIAITPWLLDWIVAAVALEFLGLSALLLRAGANRWVAPLFLYLMSGVFLMLALRASLAAEGARWIGLFLLGSLLTHAASLWRIHAAASWRRTGLPKRPLILESGDLGIRGMD